MDFINAWLPIGIALFAVLIAFLAYFQKRDPNEPVTLEGVIEDTVEVVSDAVIFTEEMTPVARTIVTGVRQRYLNGDLSFEELKPEAMTAMRLLFPDADEDLLENAVEAAIFFAKLTAGPLWHKMPDDTGTNEVGGIRLGNPVVNSGTLVNLMDRPFTPTTGDVAPG